MSIFGWIRDGFRQATVEGITQGLADVGLVPEGSGPKEVRQAIAEQEIEDEPVKGKRKQQ